MMRPPFSFAVLLGLVLLFPTGCTTTDAPSDENRPVFIERLGVDTLSVERYRRDGNKFSGEIIVRAPVTQRIRYEARLSDADQIAWMEVGWTVPKTNANGPPPRGYQMAIDGDSATVIRWGERGRDTTRHAVPGGVIPVTGKLPIAYGIIEQALRQSEVAGPDTFMVSFFFGSTHQLQQRALVRIAPDSVVLDFFGNPMIAGLDETGRLRWRSGAQTTLKMEGERALGSLDFGRLANHWAARDAAGSGFGTASPPATIDAQVDGARLLVDYSRPAKRGRKIWDGLVPFGQVWRTGANAATQFSTDRELVFGDTRIPAGDYTLYSRYTTDQAHLIINRQTGQWGTVYDETQDLARIPLQRSAPDSTAEHFTIEIEDTPTGGAFHLTWDDGRFSTPFQVR